MYKTLTPLILLPIILTGCAVSSKTVEQVEIKNLSLYDKVKACGMGISISESLSAHLANLHTSPALDIKSRFAINEQVKAHVLNELKYLSKKDRLKAYEDYCICIQNLKL